MLVPLCFFLLSILLSAPLSSKTFVAAASRGDRADASLKEAVSSAREHRITQRLGGNGGGKCRGKGGGKGSCRSKKRRRGACMMMRVAPTPTQTRESPAPSNTPVAVSPASSPVPSSSPSAAPSRAFACTSLSVDPDTGHLYGFVNLSDLGNLNDLGINKGMTFIEARTFLRSSPAVPRCCNQTVHLASIMDGAENERFRAKFPSTQSVVGLTGLNNVDNPPNYAWEGTIEAVSYTNWCGPSTIPYPCGLQHPFLTNNSCAALIPNNGYWFNYDCATVRFTTLLLEYDCDPPRR
jgi:hypothetical protein